MNTTFGNWFRQVFRLRWHVSLDLLVVAVSWLLVTGSLYTANIIIGPEAGGGLPYFFLYAGLTATLFGVGLPVFWMVVVRRRPLDSLGITTQRLGWSLALQVVLSIVIFLTAYLNLELPAFENLAPLIALSLAIGFFEAVFWRGWVQLRLEEAFGILPAILLASGLYALYHIGYGMPAGEIRFLFWIGIMFAVVFRLTKNVFILWPLFQPMGQLLTLIGDGLELPLLASLGFVEALALMFVLVWLARRYLHKRVVVGAGPEDKSPKQTGGQVQVPGES